MPRVRTQADNDKFKPLDTLEMPGGKNSLIKGIISQRKSNGVITFAIVREFERDGIAEWTSFFSEAQMPEFKQMLELVEKRIAALRKDPNVAPLRAAGAR